jgi:hypothetical protein
MKFCQFPDCPPHKEKKMDITCKRTYGSVVRWSTVKRQRSDQIKERRQFYCQNSPACFRLWWDDVCPENPVSICKTCHTQTIAIPIESHSGPALYSCGACKRQWVKKGENYMFTEETCKGCSTNLRPVKVGTHLFVNKTVPTRPT